MNECKKCGCTGVKPTYIPEGKLIYSSSVRKVDDEFVGSYEYDFYYQLKAKKEHLFFTCQDCKFSWRENVKDSY